MLNSIRSLTNIARTRIKTINLNTISKIENGLDLLLDLAQ